jgi:hypothetical protein
MRKAGTQICRRERMAQVLVEHLRHDVQAGEPVDDLAPESLGVLGDLASSDGRL